MYRTSVPFVFVLKARKVSSPGLSIPYLKACQKVKSKDGQEAPIDLESFNPKMTVPSVFAWGRGGAWERLVCAFHARQVVHVLHERPMLRARTSHAPRCSALEQVKEKERQAAFLTHAIASSHAIYTGKIDQRHEV